MKDRPGISYRKKAERINEIYAAHARSGLSNREIWRRYIYPVYGICERAFYNILKSQAGQRRMPPPGPGLFD